MQRREFVAGSIAMAAAGRAAPALAQSWPHREIRLILSVAPGGSADAVARQVGKVIARETGGTVIVKNVVGASGLTGMVEMAGSVPDGHTLAMVNIGSLLILPHVMPVPFTWKDLAFLGAVSQNFYGVTVAANSPFKTFQDVVAAGKGRRITYAAATIMNGAALMQVSNLTGAKFQLISTDTDAQSLSQAAGGFVDLAVTSSTITLPLLESGRLRLIAATPSRWPNYPDVPTFPDMGWEAATVVPLGFACPASVPGAVRARLEAAVAKAAADPVTLEMLEKTVNMPKAMNGEQFRQALMSQAPVVEAMLAEAGMKKR